MTTNETVLVDDTKETKVETPEVEIVDTKKKSNNDLIIAIVLIVLVIGAYLLFNYLNKKKPENHV